MKMHKGICDGVWDRPVGVLVYGVQWHVAHNDFAPCFAKGKIKRTTLQNIDSQMRLIDVLSCFSNSNLSPG